MRAGAALALLVAAGGLYGAIVVRPVHARAATIVEGNTWTSQDAILAALAVPAGTNVFTVKTDELEARLEQIPAVAGATVSIALPDQVRVAVAEHEALLAWRVGQRRYLVDADGTLFGELGDERPGGGRVAAGDRRPAPRLGDARRRARSSTRSPSTPRSGSGR